MRVLNAWLIACALALIVLFSAVLAHAQNFDDTLAKFAFHNKTYKLEQPEEKGLRQVRLLSHEVKPDLSFLEGVVEDLEWNEVVQTRGRSSTLN